MTKREGPLRALVTGGSSGIGLATAIALAARGVELELVAHSFPTLSGVDARYLAHASRHTVDLCDTEAVPRLLSGIEPVDFLVNCAGIYHGKSLDEYATQELVDIHQVNVLAPVELAIKLAALGTLSRIVNVASIVARTGSLDGPYAKSKRDLLAQSRNMARLLADRKIAVNAVLPGVVEGTALFDRIPGERKQYFRDKTLWGSFFTPKGVASCIVSILLDFPQEFSGQEVVLNNGWVD